MLFAITNSSTITLGPDEKGQTITLRRPVQKDKDELQDTLGALKVDAAGAGKPGVKVEGGAQEMRMLIGSMRRFRRLRTVVAWTLKDDSGTDIPLSEANLDRLAPDIIGYLDDEVAKLWDGGALTAEAKNG